MSIFQDRARRVIQQESEAIRSIPDELIGTTLEGVAHLILQCGGKIVVTGMGKNGHIGKRIAATFSCTGTASVFMHPSESAHGDLGMISPNDILLALSNSGKTQEIIETVQKVRESFPSVKIVVITGHPNETLSQLADISLSYGEIIEPCPLGLTPSSSLAVMSALSDALALGIMEMRGFTVEDYGKVHRHGYISKKIAEMKHQNE